MTGGRSDIKSVRVNGKINKKLADKILQVAEIERLSLELLDSHIASGTLSALQRSACIFVEVLLAQVLSTHFPTN